MTVPAFMVTSIVITSHVLSLHQMLCRCSHQTKIALWLSRPGGKAEWRHCTEASRQPGEDQGVCAQQDTVSPQLTGLGLQENGKAVSGPDLTVKLNGLTMPNPFVIGSGETKSTYLNRAVIHSKPDWMSGYHLSVASSL